MSHLYLSQHLRDQLGLLASLAYPHEACGVLFGKQVQGHISVHKVEQIAYPDQTEGDFRLELLNQQQIDRRTKKAGTGDRRHLARTAGPEPYPLRW